MLYIHGVSTHLLGAYFLFHPPCDRSSLLPLVEAHCCYEAISVINAKAILIRNYVDQGGWTGGNRTDYSRPLFYHFLSLGFIVTSMDYRLLPETKIEGQMEDVRDVEGWLRKNLAREVKEYFSEIQSDKIIVAGASAGAHLALLTVSF